MCLPFLQPKPKKRKEPKQLNKQGDLSFITFQLSNYLQSYILQAKLQGGRSRIQNAWIKKEAYYFRLYLVHLYQQIHNGKHRESSKNESLNAPFKLKYILDTLSY